MTAKEVRKARFVLTGTTPLLMHNDDVEAATALDAWRKDPAHKNMSVPGDDRTPGWTWQTYLYRDEAGYVCLPADNLMVALRQAGAKMTLKRQTTFKAISQSGLLIVDDFLAFTNSGTQISTTPFAAIKDEPFSAQRDAAVNAGFELLTKRAVVGTKKHVRTRPMFRAWQVSGSIQIMASEITFEHLSTLFGLAGDVGLCDWRPGCKTPGRFGMFEAKVSRE